MNVKQPLLMEKPLVDDRCVYKRALENRRGVQEITKSALIIALLSWIENLPKHARYTGDRDQS
jgi:hypothetical protein